VPYEIFNLRRSTKCEPHRYILLGTNIKGGFKKLATFVSDRAAAKWMVVLLGGALKLSLGFCHEILQPVANHKKCGG
jgi:hypothetical protein